MIILGIDTSTNYGSVAIAEKGRLLCELPIPLTESYSKGLLNTIDNILEVSKISGCDIDGYAISIGPGSFTGLRIGLSTCKGFNLAMERPIIPVETLDAMVDSISLDFQSSIFNLQSSILLLCPIIDAKRGEVYTSFYRYEGGYIKKVTDDMVISPENLCKKITEPTFFFGDGVKPYRDIIKDRLGELAYFYAGVPKNSIAASIALMGIKKIERGDVVDSMTLKPKYIRRSEAEIKWEERQKSKGGKEYDITGV
ncbi:MAG: tRNA (adenosine(37)-N6)-threonylcarbamoyltransferase complex dimerization subunit type 1 TsaB [Nitrospinota bacterium]|jgi:tRNA threonylcarbamoyladenosine biosynthesis protein TsaB